MKTLSMLAHTSALKLLVATVALGISAGSIAMSFTSALFSANQSGSANTFESGTVTVGNGPASTVCTLSALMPGDSSTGFGSGSAALTPCSYNVVYTGSASAWLAVDVSITSGSTVLYSGTSTGLQLLVAVQGGATIVNGMTYKVISGVDTAVVAGTPVTNVLLSTTPAVTSAALQFNINYLLPLLAPNALQGGSATVTLTFHAVQSANQVLGSCLAGRQCNTITWS